MGESEHYSCDEEDYDNFSSVSQVGGPGVYDNYCGSWNEEGGLQGPTPTPSTGDWMSRCSKASEDVETSSQVARSIISGLFHTFTASEDIPSDKSSVSVKSKTTVVTYKPNESARSTRLDFEGSDCSNNEYQLGEHQE